MNAADRTRAERLESIMRRHEAWETRTLADLRTAGFRVVTVDDARDRLAAQRSLSGFTQTQIDIATYAIEQSKKRRKQENGK